MKYKAQNSTDNPFLDDIKDLLALVKQFSYAVSTYSDSKGNTCYKTEYYVGSLTNNWKQLLKLAIALDPEHKTPTITVELIPTDSLDDLKDYEEKYYNMLKEIMKNALEDKEVEVIAYLSEQIRKFEHYFCTLNEDNVSRETSSQ